MSEPGKLRLATNLQLALRNLDRNRRRTGLTLVSLVVGIAALTFLSALNDGWLEEMKSNFILTVNGHVQVHARGFEESQSIQQRITDPQRVERSVAQMDQVAAWTPRLRTSGLAASTRATAGIQLMAVDPVREGRVTRLLDCVDKGRWLTANTPEGVLLGRTLAENLGVAEGDKIVLMAQRPSGEMASEVFYLRGTLCAGAPQLDRTLAVVALGTAQRWLGVGADITDVVIRASDHDAAGAIRERLAGLLPTGEFEVMGWQELDPMVRQWLRFSTAYSLVVMFVVMALVVAEVLNTMLMALHERTRELGVMEAVGTTGDQLFKMVLIESLLLVLVGGLVGCALGALSVAALVQDMGVVPSPDKAEAPPPLVAGVDYPRS
jgi:putative ABC transport system permease protein